MLPAGNYYDRWMRSIPLTRSEKLRCAPFHLGTGADPIGSAGSYDAFLCVEVPLPWQHDISEHEPYRSLGATASIAGADRRSWRPQGLVPRGDTGGLTRVIAMEQPSQRDGMAGPYRRREWWVEPAQVLALSTALVGGDRREVSSFDVDLVDVPDGVVDLFVCTHGRRDVCCGGMGTVLHGALAEELAEDPTVRLWRVSHTGGHRFAPTALTFPDGYGWAHLDLELALQLVRRDGPVGQLLDHCRGVSSLSGPAAQVADREALAANGWDWCRAHRTATAVAHDHDHDPGHDHESDGDGDFGVDSVSDGGSVSEVELSGELVDHSSHHSKVLVELAGWIPQPTCGVPLGDATATAPVWRVAQ